MVDLGPYEELLGIARRTPRAMPDIVVRFGSEGERFAATRVGRGRIIQCRKWNASAKGWTKWSKLFGGDMLRLATASDREYFKPEYGPAWERE